MLAHPPGNVGGDGMAVFELHPEGSIGQGVNDGALHFNMIFFRQGLNPFLGDGSEGATLTKIPVCGKLRRFLLIQKAIQ